MGLHLRAMTHDDLPQIKRWLYADHVRDVWGDPEAHVVLLGEAPRPGAWRAVMEADGKAIGLVLWQHPSRAELDAAGLVEIPTSVIDIDIMIGETRALGQGFGTDAIRQMTEMALSNAKVPYVMACARWDNYASQRAFSKAGFRHVRSFDELSEGPYVLMIRER